MSACRGGGFDAAAADSAFRKSHDVANGVVRMPPYSDAWIFSGRADTGLAPGRPRARVRSALQRFSIRAAECGDRLAFRPLAVRRYSENATRVGRACRRRRA